MKIKNTANEMVKLMTEAGEADRFIIGWLISMVDQAAKDDMNNTNAKARREYGTQWSINNGVETYREKLQKN